MTASAPLERTLVLLKPDAVKRGLMGEIISRFERAGLKVVGCRFRQIDRALAIRHYFDIAERRGENVLDMLLTFMTSGPVLSLCVEGIDAAENVRRLVGATEPKAASPGTIRGDYAHVSYGHSDATGRAIQNLVHASGNSEEAKFEVSLWFEESDLIAYKLAAEEFILG